MLVVDNFTCNDSWPQDKTTDAILIYAEVITGKSTSYHQLCQDGIVAHICK